MKVTLQFDTVEAAIEALTKLGLTPSTNGSGDSGSNTVASPTESASAPVQSNTPTPGSVTSSKRKRRTKAEIEAANAVEATPAPTPEPVVAPTAPVDDDLFDDFDDPAPAVTALTQEDVRGALLAFKNALAAKLIEKGTEAKEANTTAMGKAKKLLNEVAGTEVMGAVTPDKFAAVVEFANKQIAKLATK